jgi:hypothetical protein
MNTFAITIAACGITSPALALPDGPFTRQEMVVPGHMTSLCGGLSGPGWIMAGNAVVLEGARNCTSATSALSARSSSRGASSVEAFVHIDDGGLNRGGIGSVSARGAPVGRSLTSAGGIDRIKAVFPVPEPATVLARRAGLVTVLLRSVHHRATNLKECP